MKLRNLRLERQPRIMIIPMIDIIFFLLVFFMMSTLYMVEQRTLPVNLPQAAAAQAELAKNVAITIAKDGIIYIDQEQIPPELFKARIQAQLARQAEAAFILRADKQAEYGRVVTVLDELKALGIKKVAVATEQAQR
ncbi:ExbD/TolR family protein [Sporomusa acidovorans]|uniref:Tol-Pal system protein TolR n=1 Tax=Sporomusa acidovorans (strain ATCC 49682 / DSM 3132 / Mol) TaxID=1123286 RepID=A0ABZ3IYJ9_SPOA4|nr:biopolymer transporter ExbD [Sporomusa acidovorans]OZC22208.1 biopolymer transport protein ExbD [Sporomusa acidovorans DSM 3132]SDE81567.1 biopolymer transport protein ExbD [Sporomusa acidovorans]